MTALQTRPCAIDLTVSVQGKIVKLISGKGTTKHQKVFNIVLAVVVFGPLIASFVHDFAAEPFVSEFATLISCVLTPLCIMVLFYAYKNGLLKTDPVWYASSKLVKIGSIIIVPFVLWGFIWINLTISLPRIATVLFGQEIIKKEYVFKDGRQMRRGCSYTLNVKSVKQIHFYYCISKRHWDSLPKGEVMAELVIKKSLFGFIIKEIRQIQK